MLPHLFHWFYCLSIPRAVLLLALGTGLLCFLHSRLRRRILWQVLLWLLLLAGCFVIAAHTVLLRSPGAVQPPVLQPLQSYRDVLHGGNVEILRSNFMNVALFYPLGLLPALLLNRKRHPLLRTAVITLLFLLFSCAIEYAQLHFALGLCEVDDVLHNTLGAFLGALAGGLLPRFFPNH